MNLTKMVKLLFKVSNCSLTISNIESTIKYQFMLAIIRKPELKMSDDKIEHFCIKCQQFFGFTLHENLRKTCHFFHEVQLRPKPEYFHSFFVIIFV